MPGAMNAGDDSQQRLFHLGMRDGVVGKDFGSKRTCVIFIAIE
ncbi:MAG: hypothetical protein AAGA37_13740 [Actinomycetota bacterium]